MLGLCRCQWLGCHSLKCKFPLSFPVEDYSLSLQPPPCYEAALYSLQELTWILHWLRSELLLNSSVPEPGCSVSLGEVFSLVVGTLDPVQGYDMD